MYFKYKAREKWNRREGVLSKGIILEKSARMEKSVKNL
jgi:hypothetical protein